MIIFFFTIRSFFKSYFHDLILILLPIHPDNIHLIPSSLSSNLTSVMLFLSYSQYTLIIFILSHSNLTYMILSLSYFQHFLIISSYSIQSFFKSYFHDLIIILLPIHPDNIFLSHPVFL